MTGFSEIAHIRYAMFIEEWIRWSLGSNELTRRSLGLRLKTSRKKVILAGSRDVSPRRAAALKSLFALASSAPGGRNQFAEVALLLEVDLASPVLIQLIDSHSTDGESY